MVHWFMPGAFYNLSQGEKIYIRLVTQMTLELQQVLYQTNYF